MKFKPFRNKRGSVDKHVTGRTRYLTSQEAVINMDITLESIIMTSSGYLSIGIPMETEEEENRQTHGDKGSLLK